MISDTKRYEDDFDTVILRFDNCLKRFISLISFIIITAGVHSAFSQIENNTPEKDRELSEYEFYFIPSFGYINMIFRDLATSPLFYRGPGGDLGLSWVIKYNKSETLFEVNLIEVNTKAKAPESNYFQTSTKSTLGSININYQYLLFIEKLSSRKLDIHIGGSFISTLNIRINSSLGNNGIGIEDLSNLMFSVKSTWDISRLQSKERKLLFIRNTLKPARRSVSFQFNTGIVNLNYRPGYAYIYNPEINGTKTNMLYYSFADYALKMNGWRFGTKVQYSRFRPGGNGYKLGFLYNATSAPGRFEPFEMASYSLQYSLIIKLK